MAYDFSGSSKRMSFPVSGLVGGTTLFIRGRTTSSSVQQFALGVYTQTGVDNQKCMYVEWAGHAGGDPMRVWCGDSTTNVQVAATPGSFSTNTWQSAGGVMKSPTSRSVFMDGVETNSTTGSVTFSTSVNTALIAAWNSGKNPLAGLDFQGALCQAAIWDVELNASEHASLARGFSPRRVRPQSLRYYVPLCRAVQDLRGNVVITQAGSPTVSAQVPRLYGAAH